MIQIIDNVKHINVDQWESLISHSSTSSFFKPKLVMIFIKAYLLKPLFLLYVKRYFKRRFSRFIQKENNKIKHFLTRRHYSGRCFIS